ncbi:MAG: IS91 family transposase [Anaerolineales bacterium]|nr:IS91 family transposase [Anaerolineales bacterium]
MTELANIFHRYGPLYRAKFGERMLLSHRQAMRDIEQCRTEALGGHIYHCDHCDQIQYSYHSCKNRHCPKCQNEAGEQWLEQQQGLLLPTPYFMVTFTLPADLKQVARSNQKSLYNILFRTSAAALQQLAQDPRFVGGRIGMVGVLHTWTRDLSYHPHVHYLVPAGALAPDGQRWLPARKDFLVHVKPLSILFRAKFRDELKKTPLFDLVPAETWTKDWVVHCQPVGSGVAALKYLAPYIFRVAISNNRILKVENDQVTFRYQDSDTEATRHCTLNAEEFIRRFLQHVLPKGFVKVRYYGFFSHGNRHLLNQIRRLLGNANTAKQTTPQQAHPASQDRALRCPKCGQAMRLIETLQPKRHRPP